MTIEEFTLKDNHEGLASSNYIEFYIGDFENSPDYWNEGSMYLNHDVYKILHGAFRKVRDNYNDYNVNRFEAPEIKVLRESLMNFSNDGINRANLARKFNFDEILLKEKFSSITQDLIKLLNKAEQEGKPFWVLGM